MASALAERRRTRRADPDRVGWVPWRTVQFAALFCGLVAAAVAIIP